MNREKVLNELNECIEHIRKNKFNKIPCWGNCQSAMIDAIELLKEDCNNCKLECLLQKYDELKEKYDALLKEQDNCENCAIAIEDRQPIVRCKDCKKRYKKSCGYFYADGRIMCDDWFCADGERR